MELLARWPLLVVFGVGVAAGVGGAVVLRPAPVVKPVREPVREVAPPEEEHDEELMAANASLVKSLQVCNRRLGELGARQVEAASAAPAASASSGGRRGERRRGPLSAEDWARFAEEGVVPYRIPCLRETPYTPSARELERLGLAPDDAEALKQAYARSNERVAAQLKPLCASALGSAEVAERVGPSACVKAIQDGARRDNPEKMREALARVAEVNAGKRPAPDASARAEPIEALMLALTAEQQKHEAELAAAFGPDEARRIATSRVGCSEQGMASSSLDSPRRGRGNRP